MLLHPNDLIPEKGLYQIQFSAITELNGEYFINCKSLELTRFMWFTLDPTTLASDNNNY